MTDQYDNYRLKKIDFKDKTVCIVLQNTNGPCPLLAVANILLLRGDISIHEDKSVVSADELLGRVGEYLLDTKVEVSDQFIANHERNVSDVIQMLPKTQRGIDVNVQFKGVFDFEFTSESMLFDFCNARLAHGWLADPQDNEMYSFIRTLSYNQLVEKQILLQTQTTDLTKKVESLSISAGSEGESGSSIQSKEEEEQEQANKTVKEGLLAEKFVNESASQLTYHGLSELHSGLKDEELCVFFRNNHFSTLYKREGELLLLVTDQGYANEPLVWEKLCQIDGDSVFLRSDYSRYEALSPSISLAFGGGLGSRSRVSGDFVVEEEDDRAAQSDRDMALALQLQQEEETRNNQNNNLNNNQHNNHNNGNAGHPTKSSNRKSNESMKSSTESVEGKKKKSCLVQ